MRINVATGIRRLQERRWPALFLVVAAGIRRLEERRRPALFLPDPRSLDAKDDTMIAYMDVVK
ncbi:hypothetical protein V2J09_013256 [Rumex salicifolius]